ncbi:hypothetical protein PPL_02026 [Heterostelium album PN500]|uniref:Uncharacterized protein n=1 Tax=Heterostelium pallidum (strain ATCC 26659 / Pp 5 / PN500) TaxID=670386 RepID=D3B156_HETP5|nr:hypothetical protein PPL_02026 [Heterostelium album PN500]EFA85030.1 hypothetical protein PPL_02026 [Heterostelium album PN500]|eukprot:XP_020437140.1 hypothetical protein PPL_02026 [Heterostelium album PN500]
MDKIKLFKERKNNLENDKNIENVRNNMNNSSISTSLMTNTISNRIDKKKFKSNTISNSNDSKTIQNKKGLFSTGKKSKTITKDINTNRKSNIFDENSFLLNYKDSNFEDASINDYSTTQQNTINNGINKQQFNQQNPSNIHKQPPTTFKSPSIGYKTAPPHIIQIENLKKQTNQEYISMRKEMEDFYVVIEKQGQNKYNKSVSKSIEISDVIISTLDEMIYTVQNQNDCLEEICNSSDHLFKMVNNWVLNTGL